MRDSGIVRRKYGKPTDCLCWEI